MNQKRVILLKGLFAIVFLTVFQFHVIASPQDSIRVENQNGKRFIIHKVEPKETAYALARKYNVPVAVIFKYNKGADQGLKLGEEILIYKETPAIGQSTKPAPIPKENKVESAKKHVVSKGETLYAISRKYKVSVEDIKRWNKLTSDALEEGMVLSIGQQVAAQTKDPIVEPTETRTIGQTGFETVVQTGICELIESDEEENKFLALHPSAPYGTILQVTNELNNQKVYVRVIGKLPEVPGNDKVVLRISKGAWNRLAAADKRFKAKVEYIP